MLSYDEVYSAPEYYWGRSPNRICQMAVDLFAPEERTGKQVIDLGCGEGRDLIHFARHGFRAAGVDLSAPGLAKAQRWAAAEGLAIQTIEAGLGEFRLTSPFDVIYSSGTLTYVSPSLRAEVFDNYRRFTRVGGYNVFNVFVEKPYLPTPQDWGADEHFFRSGELLLHYWDWEVIHFSEFEFDCSSGGQPHRHAMEVMIARKIVG